MTTKEEEKLMKKYGITREVKFNYKNNIYSSLEQAINFADLEQHKEELDTPVYWDTTKEL